ncbi:AAA family ATPase [Tritonibacter scottomollicae]|uniref:ATPase family protein associated with various cellular activities (AAA) n=1 Tax=Tritonibacter scottomollicae TaxID=483013 RepID=A0A2T1A9N2_TRISK|nr:AAA family ATPase [Tritonibacter scottomollicae]PRZ45306.1 ATPase family protein associated with various cellular activities (AAA) [Tritonibacter scottomollicae]
MTKIKFIDAHFSDPDENEFALKRRFEWHLRKLRALQDGVSPKVPRDFEDELRWNEDLIAVHLSEKDRNKVLRRARRVMGARAKASGLSHLRSDDRRALEVFRGGAELVGIASEHRADEIAAAIHAEMPWMAAATDFLWKAMRRSVRAGEPGFRLPPVLLDGPPGGGKSVWSRELGRHLGVPRCGIEGTAEQASFVVNGSQRGWGSAFPGRPLQAIVQSLCANPIVVIDEIEKAGRPTSTKGQAYGLADGLLPLLERSSAVAWKCPYYQVGFDMSWISWVLTSNSLRTLPAPFLSRLDILRLVGPGKSDLISFAEREAARRGLSDAALGAICEVIDQIAQAHELNLRHVSRMLSRAEAMASSPLSH